MIQSYRPVRRGAVLVLVTMCMIALMAMLALAIDIGTVAVARNQCQNAADASAMAGARVITGDTTNNNNVAAAPGQAITAAMANQVLGQAIQGNMSQVSSGGSGGNNYTYTTGQITVQVGTYAYTYNDSSPSSEGFAIQIPRTDSTEPYSVVRSTINSTTNFSFARVLGLTSQSTAATSTAAHRPRDVMIIVDLSGSMRFQSVPGTPMSGGAAVPEDPYPRTVSLNPDTNYPQFGHYADTSTAALMGNKSYLTDLGVTTDPSNLTTTSNSGPPIVLDFYANAVGTQPGSGSQAFTSASSGYNTTPGGDIPLTTSLNTTTTYAQTINQFNSNSSTTNTTFEQSGYAAYASSKTFNGYTQGPGYWGKTFWIWPPCPQPAPNATATPPILALPTLPTSLTTTTFDWSYSAYQVTDWRQRFFVGVKNGTTPCWIQHNSILMNAGTAGTSPFVDTPGATITVSENGANVSYSFRINYQAILYWLNQGPNPFPSTLQAGRIRYYTKMPTGTDNTLNNRWWTSSSLPNDEQFWKDYIDFVLGYTGNGPMSYVSQQNSYNISSFLGGGDYYTWSGSTVQIGNHPSYTPATPGLPYENGLLAVAASNGATQIQLTNASLTYTPNVNDYFIVSGTSGPHVITAVSKGSSNTTLTFTPKLTAAGSLGVSVSIYSPYMSYTDSPARPRLQYWFGPQSFLDWLGNYQLWTWNGSSHHWWPGNCHEAQCWACKAGIQTAINDIQNNHPNDFIGMTFFSTPQYSNSGSGHHNCAVVPMGRSYQRLIDSLWFPPTTVSGSATEISPYDTDMNQVPRANGGTCYGMGFMIAYNQFSSSVSNLRLYATPSTTYRGSAGGLGRKGANRLVIFETDGYPNTRAVATLTGSGSDAYYQIRVKDPTNLSSSSNVEWPTGGTYANSDVYSVVSQIVALDTASPPGYSTSRKKALVYCIGYGSIFDPANAGSAQTTALGILSTIQTNGNVTSGVNVVYGTNTQRVNAMQAAFKAIMQSGVQVSLLQ